MNKMKEYNPNRYWRKSIHLAKNSEGKTWSYGEDSYEEGQYEITIDKCYFDRLKEICKDNDLLSFAFIVSAFKVSLSKYLSKKDITIGIPCYRSVGRVMLNKVLPLTSHIDYDQSFSDYMMSIKDEILQIYKNQSYLNTKILQDENINNLMELTPINISMKGFHQEKDINYILSSSKNQLSLIFESIQNGSDNMKVIYNKKQFSKFDVENLSDNFFNVFKSVLVNYKQKVSEVELLSEEEKNQLLNEFNHTDVEYPKGTTIQQIFEEQVERTPDHIAVVYEENKLTYRELNEKANSLARTLREKGAAPETVVALMMDRSIEMIVGVLGIIKSGAAYIPIDPDYPKERVSYILQNSQANLVITETKLADSIDIDGQIIDIQKGDVHLNDTSNLEIINKQEDLLYVLYTSGTTGKPKGVMVTQSNLINMVYSWKSHYHLDQFHVNLLQMASISFDVFTGDLCRSILTGGTMYICPSEIRINMEELYQTIKKNHINIFESTPSLILTLMDYVNENNFQLDCLKLLILGSDICSIEDYKGLVKNYGQTTRILNSYGVTEATIDSSYYEEKIENISDDLVNTPIGKPLHNTKFYILNEACDLQPIGVIGELYIGGEGVSRGYYNMPELTAEKFVDNPFAKGTTLYRTGDLARWLPDGNIEFLGRIDNQIKIRGFRIEPGEIENRLLQHGSIKEAIVLAKEIKENEYLCAYVVSDKEIQDLNLSSYLIEFLPKYMIPTYFVQMEKMPLTPNGKLDRKALPEPKLEEMTNKYEAPRNEVEEILARIWGEVLKVGKVGINDNFFDLGGHSLKATILAGRIRKELNVDVPLKKIFSLGNIKGLSENILTNSKKKYEEIQKVEEKEYHEASSAQKRMYMLQELNTDSIAYNMPGILEIIGKLDLNRLNEAFAKLIDRHETLRTSFIAIEDRIVQKVHVPEEIKFEIEKVNTQSEQEINVKVKEFIKPFDLEKAPLLRVSIQSLEKDRHILLLDMHHIISDGVSVSILAKEFSKLYAGEGLEVPRVQYKDYSTWQLKKRESEEFRKQEEYWLKEFRGEIPVLNLPTDYTRPKIKDFNGGSISFFLDKEISEKLKWIAKENESTLYMILLANINILLSKYSGQEDIVVGSVIAGRNHRDLENIIGMFVNTLAIRTNVDSELTFKEYFKSVREKTLSAYENQDYQFEELVEKVVFSRELNRNPIFDVMFVLQNTEEEKLEAKDLTFKPYHTSYDVERFDITINATEENNRINFHLSYATSIYKQETIERMVNHFVNIVKEITKNVEIKLKDIEIVSKDEKNKLLAEFNDTALDYSRNITIHELFEGQVKKTPDHVAVVFEGKKLTYRELNERSNSLARVLRSEGVGPEVIVGIITERSIEVIVGIMAVLKAGGAYLPIDPKNPHKRIEYMIKNSGVNILLTQNSLLSMCDYGCEVIDLNNQSIYQKENNNLNKISNHTNLAYVIYTSGTTGDPKGVAVEHKGIINLTNTFKKDFQINSNKKILQFASISFDAFAWELSMSLLLGAELIITTEEILMNPVKLSQFIKDHEVNILTVPPFIASELDLDDSKVELIITAGSDAKKNIVSKLSKKRRYINAYGPTESTICATMWDYENTEYNTIPIGKPISNTKVYIVDKYHNLLPIGVVGELCISGDGITRGYLANQELTDQKFVNNPFELGKKMYKTGDLARWLPDGNIEFLGRIDHQVKIRGFRIELPEIESRLLEIEGVKDVIVLDIGEHESKYLCAYYVAEKEYSATQLREALKHNLPDYMIPSYFKKLSEMPLTTNGKIDRKSLPQPNSEINTGTEYEAPRNEIENVLVNVWGRVLGVNRISINDNYFSLGGNSLNAIKIASILQEENINIALSDIFMYQDIKSICKHYIAQHSGHEQSNELDMTDEYISEENIQEFIELTRNKVNTEYEEFTEKIINKNVINKYKLSEIQKMSKKIGMTKSGTKIEFNFEVDISKLESAVSSLINRENMLRAAVVEKQSEIYLYEYDTIENVKLPYLDLSKIEKEKCTFVLKKVIKDISNKVHENNNYTKNKIYYAFILVKHERNRFVLYMIVNHLIFDGMSSEIVKNLIVKEYMNDGKNRLQRDSKATYLDYINQIKKGPQEITEEEIIRVFNLYEFFEASKIYHKQLSEIKHELVFKQLEFDVPNEILNNQDQLWEFAFEKFIEVYRQNLDIMNLPISILNMGRRFGERNYFTVIGEFLDIVPYICTIGDSNFENISSMISLASEKNINFITIMKDKELSQKYKKVSQILNQSKLLDFNIPVFNYLGVYDADYKMAQLFQTSDNTEHFKEDKTQRGANCYIRENKLIMLIDV